MPHPVETQSCSCKIPFSFLMLQWRIFGVCRYISHNPNVWAKNSVLSDKTAHHAAVFFLRSKYIIHVSIKSTHSHTHKIILCPQTCNFLLLMPTRIEMSLVLEKKNVQKLRIVANTFLWTILHFVREQFQNVTNNLLRGSRNSYMLWQPSVDFQENCSLTSWTQTGMLAVKIWNAMACHC